MVELPSKPQSGSWSSVGNEANSLICVLPRKFGTGVYPSSQIYSSLYLVIEPLILTMRKLWNRSHWRHTPTRPPSASSYQAFNVPIRRSAVALLRPAEPGGPGKIHTIGGAAKARGWGRLTPAKSCGWSRKSRPILRQRRAIRPGRSKLRQSPATMRQPPGAVPATFALAQALVICPLPHRRQNRKCLQIIQQMTSLWSGCIRAEARTISVLVTTHERVGRTIKPTLRNQGFGAWHNRLQGDDDEYEFESGIRHGSTNSRPGAAQALGGRRYEETKTTPICLLARQRSRLQRQLVSRRRRSRKPSRRVSVDAKRSRTPARRRRHRVDHQNRKRVETDSVSALFALKLVFISGHQLQARRP